MKKNYGCFKKNLGQYEYFKNTISNTPKILSSKLLIDKIRYFFDDYFFFETKQLKYKNTGE
ncbi:MAG: hypothetical protein WDA74_06410 [Spirochaetota bacterium]